MAQTKIINGIKIEHDGNVSRGLEYLEKRWKDEEIQEILENARRANDQDSHFHIFLDGSDKYYILKHIGYDTYFLKPSV